MVPRPAADDARLVVRLRARGTGEPLAGVAVLGYGFENGRSFAGRSDERGEAVFERLLPGTYSLQLAPAESVEVGPDQETRYELELEPLAIIRGEVVDESDRPVPGAKVRLTDHDFSSTHSVTVAETAADGRFTCTTFVEGSWLFVSAIGFQISPVYDLYPAPGEPAPGRVELRIRLRRPSVATVSGVVVDAATGSPVSEAAVWLEPGLPPRPGEESSARDPVVMPLRNTLSDDQGRFAFVDLGAGEAALWARARGFGQEQSLVELRSPAVTGLRIALGAPLILHGRVVDDEGTPLVGARLSAGELTRPSFVHTRTAAGGHFTLVPLPDRTLQLHAFAEGYRTVHRRLRVPSGSTQLVQELVMPRERELPGTLLDERGQPLAGWWLSARDPAGPTARSDSDGEFVLDAREAPELFGSIEPAGRAAGDAAPQRLVRDPAPGPNGRWIWRARRADSASAILAGRIETDPDVEDPKADLTLRIPGTRWEARVPLRFLPGPPAGRFETGPWPPGTYAPRVSHGERETRIGWLDLAPVTLRAQERHDLGTVTVPAAVPLELEVVRPDGVGWSGLWLRLLTLPEASPVPAELSEHGQLRAFPLRPGRYRLQVQGAGVEPWSEEIELRPATPERVVCLLEPASDLILTAAGAGLESLPRHLHLLVEDPETDRLRYRIPIARSGLVADGVCLGLPDGRHRIRLAEVETARPIDVLAGHEERVEFRID